MRSPLRARIETQLPPCLLDRVKTVCARLAPLGWRELLLAHGVDILATDLRTELLRPLTSIDRHITGFQDFALEGCRGIEPGRPALSLLYHALASPQVVANADGQ